jgi:TPR repeat protein
VAYLHADKLADARACETAATAGDAEAEFQYGLILWSGVDRPTHDHRAALEWIRKSARQGHLTAQISLGAFLPLRNLEPDSRNPIEGYAWLMTAGDEQGAHKLRATFNQTDAAAADRMAAEFKSKYAPLQASRAGWWLRATDLLTRIWPGLAVLGFFLASRRRLTRKLLFVVVGIVIAYASQYLALWTFALGVNTEMMRLAGSDQILSAVVWTFGLAFALSLLAPTLGVWAVYRLWMRRQQDRASA